MTNIFCPQCGNKLANNSKFCGKCGNLIKITENKKLLEIPAKKTISPTLRILSTISIIGLLGFIGLIIFGLNNDATVVNRPVTPIQSTQPVATTRQVVPAPKNIDVNLKSKCATDGQAFYLSFYKQFTQVKSIWFDPEFHFNSRLNTCLVYIQWNDNSIPDIYKNDMMDFHIVVMNNNIVFDVYSNQAILQSDIIRTSDSTNGKVQETDTLNEYPYAQNIPNSNGNTFGSQLKVLMNE